MGTKLWAYLKKYSFLLLANIFGLYLFAKMAEDVIEKEFIVVVDRWISIHINVLHTPMLNEIMIELTDLNGGVGILVFSLLFAAGAAYFKWYRDLWFYILSVGGAAAAFVTIKLIVQRVRPESGLLNVTGYSFPSGHATMSMSMAAALYFILSKRVHGTVWHLLLLLVCMTWPLMIAASRVYLDVHWLSDVIAGLGLGLFWVTLVILFFEWKYDGRS